MKNKSSNHKSTNRFKFTTFAERVNAIDVRRTALYHLDHVNTEAPSENETFFYNAVQKWKVLNLTTEYVTFSKKVEQIITLPQLLHRKDEVVDLLLEYLKNGNVLTIQPLLELVVVLARDLQEEFYAYFPRFLNCLIKLLNTKEPEQLEWTLICLAFIFKSLRVYLKRDISVVFDAVLPILSDSMPPYVSNFAAESFAFVARDIRDKKKFLQILIKSVNINKNAIIGCGRLLFEVVRGVSHQFHSCAAQFLPFLFETLGDNIIHQKTLFKVLTQTVTDMLEVIHPKNSEIFWTSILFTINTSLNQANAADNQSHLEYMLRLVGQALEYESGIFLINPFPVLVLIVQLLETKFPESIYKVTSQVGVLVLMCNHTNIPHENAVSLVKKILGMPYPSLVLDFVEEVINCPSFDMIVLPHFISSIDTFDRKIIKVLSKICLTKSPLCKSGIDLYSWVKYPIDFQNQTDAYSKVLFNSINCDISKIVKSPEDCICALVCLPHIKNINTNHAHEIQGKLLSGLIEYLTQLKKTADEDAIENISSIRNVLFMIATTMEAVVHTVDSKIAEKYCSIEKLINALTPYICEAKYVCSLRILDLFLTVCQREKILHLSSLQSLYEPLSKNLTSPFHEVRLLTTHICSNFEDITPKTISPKKKNEKKKSAQFTENSNEQSENEAKKKYEMFSLCYNVEVSPLSMSDYRDQLVKISKMTFGSLQHEICEDEFYKNFALKYVLGLLHVNFKLLWEPLQSFIVKYAQSMSAAEFWPVFSPCLQNATLNAREGILIPSPDEGFISEINFLGSLYGEYYNISVKPDFSLYRIHLWEILYQAPTLSESKNRDITPLFLEFLKEEFEKPYEADVFITDITNDSMIMDVDDSQTQDESDNDISEAEDKKVKISRATYDTLIAYFKVYSNIQNPKAMFMEERLRKIYLDFLMHKNPIIQKIALDCFLRYKNKHLTPYKQNLYNLVDGKKFKDELRTFKIEADESSIQMEDRNELIPIILRIAYSKMITKTGVDKKGGSQLRRSLVMRFLAGCEEPELIAFTNMAFNVFEKYLTLNVNVMIQRIEGTLTDLLKIPPKKLVGALNLVDSMREQFTRPGQEVLLLRLLKVVICIGTFINGILADQHKLKRGYMSILKDIRNQCINSIARFFQQFEKYEWSFDDHLLPIFNIFIWPVVEKLPMEGIHSPTPLLKLFNIWSQNPRYHSLFNVQSNKSLASLPFFFNLMNANKLHHTVSEMCTQILERLLTMEVEEGVNIINVPSQFLIKHNIEEIEQLNLSEKLNHGSVTLIPHIPIIVTILKDKLSNINPKKLQKRELVILSRVTELALQPDIVDSLLTFSLPILIHRVGHGAAEDTLEASLNALITLLNKASNPRQHVRLLAPLFSKVTPASSRRLLCKVLEVLAKDESSKLMASIIADMNASDEKWLEQPDFDKRLSAYKQIFKLSDEGSIDVELGAMIIHNCFFVIQRDTDISLRNTAVACLHKIIPKLLLTVKECEKDFLLKDTVLLLIRNSLKANSESLVVEGISLLGELVRECSNSHPVFKELLPVSNKHNKEIDFFENLQHLQFHRKVRALQRFCSFMKESKQVPSHKTLTQFIIPLASQFICSEKYTPKYALVDAAIETVGAVCQLLPWHQYEAVLKFYVGKLQRSSDYQKQLIKLVSIILDAFHFDLSKTDSIPQIPTIMSNPETDQEKIDKAKEEITESGLNDELEIPLDGEEQFESNDVEQQPDILPFERVVTLSPSAAKRVISTITEILNQLDWSSSQLLEHEARHKKINSRMSNRREAEEKLKLPMALAVVKLLQKLPQPMLKNNILSVLIKVCAFLKSPMIGVRASARDIISKIMSALGTSQLGTLLWHLTTMLTRGIHVHVLISTVHMILTTLKDGFGPGEMDKHLQNILKVCLNDLFGKASEEKQVVKLGSKAPEAKPSMKSFSTLRIIAQNISEFNITNLLKPFKDVAESSHSKRTVLKIQSALQNISIGLMDNKYISVASLLSFLSSVFSDSIVTLKCGVKKQKKTDEREDRWKALRPDCMIIPANPRGKKGLITKVIRNSAQANAHVLIEFGLNVFHIILQKDKLVDDDFKSQVDLLVPYIIESLKSPQVKVVTLALKCITSLWAKKFDLPSMKSEVKHTSSTIFQILHKYATSGLSKKDDNFHLVANAFRAVTALIRDVKYYTINEEEMRALLLYAEHDIHDSERQATAFSLLKAIITANYKVSEINEIIQKVADITILSESVRTREESRTVILVFIMNCHINKKIEQLIQFYIKQLEYEMDHGRISAIKMIQTFIEKFTVEVLTTHATLLYVSLGRRMVNEQTTDCRILLAECIELLLQRISIEKRNDLFKLNMALFGDPKPIHTELAAQLTSRYLNVEKQNFKSRLAILLPELTIQLIGTQITVGRFVRINPDINNHRNSINDPSKDNCYIQVLNVLNKLCETLPGMFSDLKYQVHLDEMAARCQTLLAHSHSWVRFHAAKFLVSFLQSLNPVEYAKILKGNQISDRMVFHSVDSLKSLTLDLSSQFIPGGITEDMAEVVCKNLLILIKMANELLDSRLIDQNDNETEDLISEIWIVKKLRSSINGEVTKAPGTTVVRVSIFNMLEEMFSFLPKDKVFRSAKILMPCLVREITKTDATFDHLKIQANKIGSILSTSLGDIVYNDMLAKVQTIINSKRKDRKQKIAQDKINNPDKAAKRKLTLKDKKKDYKRKKFDIIKGRLPNTRKSQSFAEPMDDF